MSKLTMIKAIKKIHAQDLVLFKVGDFYHSYGKDAYILSYLFDYKIKYLEENIATIGFPKSALPRNIAKIEQKSINYVLVDRRNNFDDDEFQNYKNLNTYAEIFEKANRYVKIKNRIDKLYETLTKEIETDNIRKKIVKLEEIVFEKQSDEPKNIK